jgi:hypothetical protein
MQRIFFLLALFAGLLSNPLRAQYYGTDVGFQPRWSLGIMGGSSVVLGDVGISPAWEAGISAQRSIQPIYDFRIQARAGQTFGQDTKPFSGTQFNSALNGTEDSLANYWGAMVPVYNNYRMDYADISIQLKLNLNRINNAPERLNWDVYLFGGAGILVYRTAINALDRGKQMYPYSTITATDPGAVRDALNAMLDDTYETQAQIKDGKADFGGFTFNTNLSAGVGFRYHVADKVALFLEGRGNWLQSDLLDGNQWNNNNSLSGSRNDWLINGNLGVDFTFGK